MDSPASAILWDDPNKFARPAGVQFFDRSVALVRGYQEFVVTRYTAAPVNTDPKLFRKWELLRKYFRPRFLARRILLDLGANGGFFSFLAAQGGADRVLATDIDARYLEMIRDTSAALGIPRIETVEQNVADRSEPADIVLALALVHWIYSCTAILGSLDAVMERLSRLCRYMLIVEWVDPTDSAIQSFGHLDFNRAHAQSPYTRQQFEYALSHYFARWEVIDAVSPTRALYAAFKTAQEIDLSGDLPFIRP
ncbi:MAG TPA: class I SAM-dependent methyltransferase, partial [Tepidisphaeraceae bacterium]|nr:class I SAM-dependent methyltransferase [Tepidisphaeraceae bacterium]